MSKVQVTQATLKTIKNAKLRLLTFQANRFLALEETMFFTSQLTSCMESSLVFEFEVSLLLASQVTQWLIFQAIFKSSLTWKTYDKSMKLDIKAHKDTLVSFSPCWKIFVLKFNLDLAPWEFDVDIL